MADRESTDRSAGWEDANDGWIEVPFQLTRPTAVPTDRESSPPIARPVEVAAERPDLLRISDVLARWRAAERALAAVPEGTPDWARIQAGLLELQTLHRALFEERLRSLEREPSEFQATLPADVLRRAWG